MCDFLQSICALVSVDLRICAAFNSAILSAYSFVGWIKNQCAVMILLLMLCCVVVVVAIVGHYLCLCWFSFSFDSIVTVFTRFHREFSISKSRCYLRTHWSNINNNGQHSMGHFIHGKCARCALFFSRRRKKNKLNNYNNNWKKVDKFITGNDLPNRLNNSHNNNR